MASDVPDRFTINLTGASLLGVFRVGERLAVGGMGAVYRAENVTLGKPVVVKVPDAALLSQPGFRKRFELEIRQLVKFNHPNVVGILAAGEHDGVPFFVLDYLGGGSLKDRLARVGGGQSPEEVLAWLRPVAGALDYLHSKGVVHRDVKPGNILFHELGVPYLSDFGIAKVLEGAEALTTTGGRLFTPAYAAPEQMLDDTGSGLLSGAADQYALAATVYEALGGRPPFQGSTSAIVAGKLRDAVPDLRQCAAHVPAATCAAVARALSRRPEDRFPTCGELVEAFERGFTLALPTTATVVRAPSDAAANDRDHTAVASVPVPSPPASGGGRRPAAAGATIGRAARGWPWARVVLGVLLLGAAVVWGSQAFVHEAREAVIEARGEAPDALAALFPADDTAVFVAIHNLTRFYEETQKTVGRVAERWPSEWKNALNQESAGDVLTGLLQIDIRGVDDLEHYGLGNGGAAVAVMQDGLQVLAFRCTKTERYIAALLRTLQDRYEDEYRVERESDATLVVPPASERGKYQVHAAARGNTVALFYPHEAAGARERVVDMLASRGGAGRSAAYQREMARLAGSRLLTFFAQASPGDLRRGTFGGFEGVSGSLEFADGTATLSVSATMDERSVLAASLTPRGPVLLPAGIRDDVMAAVEVAFDPSAAAFRRVQESEEIGGLRRLLGRRGSRWLARQADLDVEYDVVERLSGSAALVLSPKMAGDLHVGYGYRDGGSEVTVQFRAGSSRWDSSTSGVPGWLGALLHDVGLSEGWNGRLPRASLALGLRDGVSAPQTVDALLRGVRRDVPDLRSTEIAPADGTVWSRRITLPVPGDDVLRFEVDGTAGVLAGSFEGAAALPVSGFSGSGRSGAVPVVRIMARPPAVIAWITETRADSPEARAARSIAAPYPHLDLALHRVGNRLEGRCLVGTFQEPGLVERASRALGTWQWVAIGSLFLAGLGLALPLRRRRRDPSPRQD